MLKTLEEIRMWYSFPFFKKCSCRMSCFLVQWEVEVSSPELSRVECFYSGCLEIIQPFLAPANLCKVLVVSFLVNSVLGQTRKRTKNCFFKIDLYFPVKLRHWAV